MFPPEKPTTSFPYQVLEQVGVGSMGVVYRAMEVDLDRSVAIKTLRTGMLAEETPEAQQEIRNRFLQEAQAAGRISHPGVTTVYRVGQEDDQPFMVMEWLDGQSLEEVMKTRRRLPAVEAARIGKDVLDALEAAHKVGVIHRDIKPSNLMLLNDGRLKVTDFGIARIQGHELVKTQAGMVLATPKFASPEQLRGLAVDGRADLFAVGVLMYHMLTGTYPFVGDSFLELANAILQNEPTPVSQLLPDVPPMLDAVLRVALRKERQERYASASLMASELASFLQLSSAPATQMVPEQAIDPIEIESTVRGLPHHQVSALVELASTWPGKVLDKQPTAPLLERLLERPLHAPAFSGAIFLNDTCLFLSDGVLLAAARRDGQSGDEIAESLPEEAIPGLHPVPEEFGNDLMPVLTSALHPPRILHADLDSTYINLPAMAGKLRDEKFSGLFRLRHGQDWGVVCFVDGQAKLSLYSEGWNRVPVEQSWQRWISEHPVHAQVEHRNLNPAARWFRSAFAKLAFEIEILDENADSNSPRPDSGSTSTRLRQLFSSSRTGLLGTDKLALRLSPGGSVEPFHGAGVHYERAPAVRFLTWMIEEMPRYFAERELFGRWKYLAEWIFLIRRATAYDALLRPGTSIHDDFDLTTDDGDGKILHLAHRLANPDVDSFKAFLDRVVTAKTARKKTGDVGGAFLIAPSFTPEVLRAYQETLHSASSSTWFGMEESFTGYEGFVRIGPRRGFHLMLVQEKEDRFEPVLLSAIA